MPVTRVSNMNNGLQATSSIQELGKHYSSISSQTGPFGLGNICAMMLNRQHQYRMHPKHESPRPTSKSVRHTEPSPKKSPLRNHHTILREDKLKVFIKFKPTQTRSNDEPIKVLNETELKVYCFDYVFDEHCSHEEVFQMGCQELIEGVLRESKQGLIFVYGNTGTGKTYTMGLLDSIGEQSRGIVPDAIRYIFANRKGLEVAISFCEIYMDEIYDLLDFKSETKLAIRENNKSKELYVENEIVITVENALQAFQLINIGLDKRRVAEQRMNRKSSRGHGIITIYLRRGGQSVSKLCLIDLAGSERLKESESKGSTMTEALHINSSLSTLETLLMNISDQNVRNYRGSKLTRLLQPYIQNGRIQLIVTSNHQSLQPIQFAKRCKGIRFMERELKTIPTKKVVQSLTAIDKSPSNSTNASRNYSVMRKEWVNKEKHYVYCISGLVALIAKISNGMKELLEAQTVHSKFSLSDIMRNQQLQDLINGKINRLEQVEESNLECNIQEFEAKGLFYPIKTDELIAMIDNPGEFSKKMQAHAQSFAESLQRFADLTQYKNIYKKEFFTAELKSNILEQKNKTFEEAVQFLLAQPVMHGNQKKIQRKLKDLGLVLQSKSTEKKIGKTLRPLDISGRGMEISLRGTENSPMNRSPIYIQEV